MQLTEYEQQRAERIQRNQALMKHIGLAEVRHELQSLAQQLRCAESIAARKSGRKRARRSLAALRDVERPESALRSSSRLQAKRQDEFSQMKLALEEHVHALQMLREEFEAWQREFETKVRKVELDRGLFATAVSTPATLH